MGNKTTIKAKFEYFFPALLRSTALVTEQQMLLVKVVTAENSLYVFIALPESYSLTR